MTRRIRPSLFLVILAGIAALAALFYVVQSKGLLLGKKGATAEVGRWIAPLKPSDLNVLFFTLDTTRADHIG